MKTRTVPPAPRCCRTILKGPADDILRSAPFINSPAAVAAAVAAYHGVRAAMPLALLPCGRFLHRYTAADNPR